MKVDVCIELLRIKLEKDKKSLKDFIEEYLPESAYSRVNSQVNGINTLKNDVKAAINKYLEN